METKGFSLSEDTAKRVIVARFAAGPDIPLPDAAAVRQALQDQHLADCHIDEKAIGVFVERCRQSVSTASAAANAASDLIPDDPVEPTSQAAQAEADAQAQAEPSEGDVAVAEADGDVIEAIIGERHDGWVEVSLSSDRMTAWLTLGAPEGGRSASVSEINAAIAAKGIMHGLKVDVLNEVVLAGSCKERVIAEGTEVVPGIEARFESLLDELKEAVREEREEDGDGIDYRDLGALILVDPGMSLVRRVPAVPGKDGVNVCGQVVPVKPISDSGFAKSLTGVEPSADDPNVLVAAISGQPKIVDGGANVNTVVNVDGVNLSSGNVVFDGTLNVKGDIQAGMSVRVAGDVIVEGTIEAAEVVAGGDVTVKGGIVGRADGAQGSADTARIQCNGSVHARFAEHAHIEAGRSIVLDTAARQCELFAGQEIIVGKGPTQGQLAGGQARALIKVRAAVLGSNSGSPTVVQVGFDPRVNAERIAVDQARKRKLEDLGKIRQLLGFLDQNPAKGQGGVREKAEKTREQLEGDVTDLDARLMQLAGQLELADGASIEVGKAIYSGVNLQIGQKLMQVLEDRGAARVRLKDDMIVLG